MAYTLQLVNSTGLDPQEFSIFVMGFAYQENLVLNSVENKVGTFQAQTSGKVTSYRLGSEIESIHLDSSIEYKGARLYIFVAPVRSAKPEVDFSKQPTNPPDTAFPPYSMVEFAYPPNQKATFDVQTVDGFSFPLTLTSVDSNPLLEVGQPADVTRAETFAAYTAFMDSVGSAGQPYLAPGFVDENRGILNPGLMLVTINRQGEFQHLDSPLHRVFDDDLNKLFSSSTLSLQGVGSNGSGSSIEPDVYSATPLASEPYPGTNVHLPALELKGSKAPQRVFRIFNPVGISILTDENGKAITGTILHTQLTLDAVVPGLEAGMYVDGVGTKSASGVALTQINKIEQLDGKTVLTLNLDLLDPAAHSQYRFSRLPYLKMFQTPGQMVFSNSGVFADDSLQLPNDKGAASVLANLENQIVSALNRGVATELAALNPGNTAGGTSAFWGTQTNWYPEHTVQNLFSLFMHSGQSNQKQIFLLPPGHTVNARNRPMAAAYGFPFDENAGPVPPAPVGQPQVPSKFDQIVPVGSTIRITLGPWK